MIQPEEAGTDCSPKYDEILGLEELSNRGFITAICGRSTRPTTQMRGPEPEDSHAIWPPTYFTWRTCWSTLIYLRSASLARLLGDSPEAAEFDREADRTLDALVTKCWDEEAGAFFDLSGVD